MQKIKRYCFYTALIIVLICLFASFETGGFYAYADRLNLAPDRMFLVYADKADELSPFTVDIDDGSDDGQEVKKDSYKLGDVSPFIREYKLKLSYLELMNHPNSSIFDTPTEQAVKDFQKKNNLEETGILDTLTMSLLDSVEIAYRYGDTDEKIGDYQAMLSRLGYLEDGYTVNTFDEKTEAALKKYQEAEKLGVTATFNSDTVNSLTEAINALNEDEAE